MMERCKHPEHLPPMTGATLKVVETKIEDDKMISVFEYTCPGCGQVTRSSHVKQFEAHP